MKILISEDALNEMRDGVDYYDSKISGLGEEFRESVLKRTREIASNPLMYPIIEQNIRKSVLQRFPYTLYYLIDHDKLTIVVLSIAHQHRKPKYG